MGVGEVGMGNTTPAAACIMAALGLKDPDDAVGRGGGLTDESFARKKRVIGEALELHHPNPDDPIDILSCVGGLDIAAMTGVFHGRHEGSLHLVGQCQPKIGGRYCQSYWGSALRRAGESI